VKTFVTDTHSLYWYLENSPKFSRPASACFDDAQRGDATILIPTIVLAELFYLNVKLGSPIEFSQTVALLSDSRQFDLVPLQAEHMLDFEIDGIIPEMHDRIIVGVARRAKAPLISCDAAILRAQVPIVW
jgi:PIN domain nuclease of toxin-antitoxin system